MNTGANHVMTKYGILTAFTIEKAISKVELRRLSIKVKKKSRKAKDFDKLLMEEIMASTRDAFVNDKIPGIIQPDKTEDTKNVPDFANDEKKILKLHRMSNAISKKFIDCKMSRDEICYTILGILGALGIDDSHFRKFNGSCDDDGSDSEFDGQ